MQTFMNEPLEKTKIQIQEKYINTLKLTDKPKNQQAAMRDCRMKYAFYETLFLQLVFDKFHGSLISRSHVKCFCSMFIYHKYRAFNMP